jgi:RNA polymerase sigma factor (sigma-70 family)
MGPLRIDSTLGERLYREARADRWRLPRAAFIYALESSCQKAFPEGNHTSRELSCYLSALHLKDLALACACAEGHADAWDHFVLEMRPHLYRSAEAIDRSGAARELADSLYADLYGMNERGESRQSLLRYFHGRSSLATWLRAVLAQRHVDRVRSGRRLDPLPDEMEAPQSSSRAADPDCAQFVDALRGALGRVVARLAPRDRLRINLYYVEQLTLAQAGRLLKEHEATVSRQLARTRRTIREEVQRDLSAQGLNEVQIVRCFECATEDAGEIDLTEVLAGEGDRKKLSVDRSI